MAVKLNQTYSRPQILRMYAEVAYYGTATTAWTPPAAVTSAGRRTG
jgi:hypothetical protein